jgi:nucleotide-binding universal stress UspA family protein
MQYTKISYSNILVAVDGSKQSMDAVNYAISLAEKYKANLIVLNVLNLHSFRQSLASFVTAPTYGTIEMEQKKMEVQKFLNQIQRKGGEKSLSIKTQIIQESISVVSSILEYAENEKIDLIVVGTRGRSGIKHLLIGSVAEGVVTYAHCPVLVVK